MILDFFFFFFPSQMFVVSSESLSSASAELIRLAANQMKEPIDLHVGALVTKKYKPMPKTPQKQTSVLFDFFIIPKLQSLHSLLSFLNPFCIQNILQTDNPSGQQRDGGAGGD